MNRVKDMSYGWEFMANVLGTSNATFQATTDYIDNILLNNQIQIDNKRIIEINEAIDNLTKNINELQNHHLDIEKLKGFVAEEWHSSTFNIDALEKGSSHRAWTLKDTSYASVDIETNFGKKYSSKYSNNAYDAENMQAILNKDTKSPKYQGQERLIAEEQLEEAKSIAKTREMKNILTRPELSQSHRETREHLVGKISDDKGVESKSLSIKNSKKIAKEAQNQEFNAEDYGFKKDPLKDQVRIDYVNKAMKAGLTAATITAITQLVPELYKSIDFLIKNGEINLNQIKNSGEKIITTSGESFLRGSIAYTVEMAIQQGLFGESIRAIDPTFIGVTVSIIYGTIRDSIFVAAGKITPNEMGVHFVDSLLISSGYIVGAKLGGTIGQALLSNVPFVGYVIGSLLGCSISIAYNIGKKHLISFCIDTGFSCFGLVDQNYELPEQVLSELGVQYIPIPKTEIKETKINRIDCSITYTQYQLETVNFTVLKRGIIGINKIGYTV